MITYALDTNIVSFMLKGDEQINEAVRHANSEKNTFVIPVAVYYEIRRGLLAVNATTQMRAFEKLCESFNVEEMSMEIWKKAAGIWAVHRQKGAILGKDDGDIFIAAHCIVKGYTLVTANTADFERIDGLSFINWKEQ